MKTSLSSGDLLERSYRGDKPWRTLASIYGRHAKSLILAAFYNVIKSSPTWIMPVITANVINIVSTPGANAARGLLLNAAVMVVALVQNIPMHWLYMREISIAARNVEAQLRAAIVRRLQLLSIAFFKNARGGALQTKVLRDVEAVDQMSRTLFDGGYTAATAILSSVIITAYRAPKFLVVFLIMVPVASGLRIFLSGSLRKGNRDFRREIESMSAQVLGMIEMIPITRAHAAEETEIARMTRKLGSVKDAGFRLDLRNALFGGVTWVTFQIFGMGSLIVGAWLSYTKIIPLQVGDVVMLSYFFTSISNAVMQIANMMPTITKGFESVRSIGEILESPDIEQNLGKAQLSNVRGEFLFENVGFTYRGTKRGSLRGFTLEVRPGETLAVVGPSGAGKSTLMNLILGFERPSEGRILLDGHDMNAIDLRSYRRFVGVVTQETLLFHGTLRENILYGGHNIPDSQVLDALRNANAAEFIEKLPDGLNTIIGDRGARLSGGQKQRIAIARALIRNPRVLILDEATSALDTASEAVVQTALDRLMKGRTTFIVAHRLSTVRNADRILVLDEGQIAEIGQPRELLERGGLYARLCAMQQIG
ncbi:MAG: ABC transporter ATP-binding protein [Chthoniobacteraceae bacterium]|nr:ABC transporter ATP-binding protein [Chthoniobacteraceae bacterium]